ncbi:sulfotransferase [Thioalkalivibrio sp. XN8]|nr:sulfotransferase [Thioalkalivibrio sp. XN8]
MESQILQSLAESPVFLIGAERSGTTLLRLMLSSHPSIAFHSESGFITHPLADSASPPVGARLREYHDFLNRSPAFRASGFTVDGTLPYEELLRSFMRQKALNTGKTTVGMTIHKGFQSLPRIWPEARYIHLIRDGRDVASSCVGMGWYGNPWAATTLWKTAIEAYDTLLSSTESSQVLELRFENLVADSDSELARISRFLNVPHTDDYYNFSRTSTYALPNKERAKSWQSQMTEFEIRTTEAEIAPLLERFDYPLSGLNPLKLTDSLRSRLIKENKFKRRRWAIRRYGFSLLALDKFGRFVDSTYLRRYTTAKMQQIRRNHLK